MGRDTVGGDRGLDDGGIFTLGATGGMFTLEDAGVTVTLRDAGGIWHPQRWGCNRPDCSLWGNDAGECRLCNGAFEYSSEVKDGLLLGVAELANGVAGAWLVRASVRARTVMMDTSTVDVLGTGHWCGKNSTVLAVRSALVLGT